MNAPTLDDDARLLVAALTAAPATDREAGLAYTHAVLAAVTRLREAYPDGHRRIGHVVMQAAMAQLAAGSAVSKAQLRAWRASRLAGDDDDADARRLQ